MERFFEKITRALVENGNIREEEEEVYQYALKSMLILGGNILLSLMIGVCMGMPGYCVLFLCMLVPLRSDAGGYHAPNLFICYLLSFASLILTMFWAKETSVFQLAIVSALALGSLLLIFLFAPLDSKNRPLEGQERKCIRKRARIVVCLEWITGGLLLLVSPPAAYTVWSAIVWSGVGYIAWYLERKIEARKTAPAPHKIIRTSSVCLTLFPFASRRISFFCLLHASSSEKGCKHFLGFDRPLRL